MNVQAVPQGRWVRIWSRVSGPPIPRDKRWTPTFVINLVCLTSVALILILQWLTACWSLGLDFAPLKCLNGTGFLIHNDRPSDIVRGRLYAYHSHGLMPLLPDGSPVVKIAAALPGDVILVNAKGVFINGRWWGALNPITLARTHRTVASVTRTFTIQPGQVLMLGDQPRSYDGRYWGPVQQDWMIGHAWKVW